MHVLPPAIRSTALHDLATAFGAGIATSKMDARAPGHVAGRQVLLQAHAAEKGQLPARGTLSQLWQLPPMVLAFLPAAMAPKLRTPRRPRCPVPGDSGASRLTKIVETDLWSQPESQSNPMAYPEPYKDSKRRTSAPISEGIGPPYPPITQPLRQRPTNPPGLAARRPPASATAALPGRRPAACAATAQPPRDAAPPATSLRRSRWPRPKGKAESFLLLLLLDLCGCAFVCVLVFCVLVFGRVCVFVFVFALASVLVCLFACFPESIAKGSAGNFWGGLRQQVTEASCIGK